MRITRPFVSALAVISVGVLFIAAQPAKADFTYYFNQTGTNTVVVTGTGSFNTAALGDPYAVYPLGAVAFGSLNFDYFEVGAVTVSGSFNAWYTLSVPLVQGPGYFWNPDADVVGASGLPTSGAWLALAPEGSVEGEPQGMSGLGLPFEYASGAPMSNTTTWNGVSLADIGYSSAGTWASPVLEGTWTLHNPTTGDPTGDTIRIYSIYSVPAPVPVPEPSQAMMLAGAGLTFGAWRMRKLRRKPAASPATAC